MDDLQTELLRNAHKMLLIAEREIEARDMKGAASSVTQARAALGALLGPGQEARMASSAADEVARLTRILARDQAAGSLNVVELAWRLHAQGVRA